MITVLGASGFVGSHLVKKIQAQNTDYFAPGRDEELAGKNLGHVIYCIGLTSDFRKRPFDTVEAHIGKLKYILEKCDFDSLTYLSSTRIYIHNDGIVDEESDVAIRISDPFDLFNISKLAGESLALNCGRKNIKIARLSNVYGDDFTSGNFVNSILRDAIVNEKVVLRTTPNSAKDYISVDDVADLVIKISAAGESSIYNVASGVNITNDSILSILKHETDCSIEYEANLDNIIFPPISVNRIMKEFGFKSEPKLLLDLKQLIDDYKRATRSKD